MWSHKFDKNFILQYAKFDSARLILAGLCFLLVIFYPGQNTLQTTGLHPGVVKKYSIAPIPEFIYPVGDGVVAPKLSSKSIVVQDDDSKTILYSKNPDILLMPASITKVMTALVALDYWSNLDTVIVVKNEDRAIGQTIELEAGESITLKNILYGLLVHSGNDAALAVADNYPGGYSAFVAAMNQKAKDLHLDHTTFKNPSGVEQYGHLTTARDLAVLASYALKNDVIAQMANTKHVLVTDVTGTIIHDLETTNELLGTIPGLKGLKTGWTSGAGECLASYVDRDGHKVIIVVLGSYDRFGETTALINWVYDHHSWIPISI